MNISKNISRETLGLGVLLVVLLAASLSLAWSQRMVWEKQAAAAEAARPADVSLVLITVPECEDCPSLTGEIAAMESGSLNIKEQREVVVTEPEAAELIERHAITRLPAIVISGETDKAIAQNYLTKNTRFSEDSSVWEPKRPLYVEALSGEVKGRVDAVVLADVNCEICQDPQSVVRSLQQFGIRASSVQEVQVGTPEAEELVKKYGFTHAPAIVFSKDLDDYADLSANWQKMGGTKAEDGSFLWEASSPPYLDLASRQVRGEVTLTYITDTSCEACYDATKHRSILESQFGLRVADEVTVDIGTPEGENLRRRYDIKVVPTVIMSPEAVVYDRLISAWEEVGTRESDGSYVFRELSKLSNVTYLDLEAGETRSTKTE